MTEAQIVPFPCKMSSSGNMAFTEFHWIFAKYKNIQLKMHLQIHW